jgi:methyl-accepting chemotaxis protein
MLTGGVGLWQVITIGRTIDDAREKQTQLVHSLELRAAGHGLVAAMDHMLVVQESLLASTEVISSLGILRFHMETLREAGSGTGYLNILDEMQVVYDELLEVANEANSLARQERWTEVCVALEQEIRPGNRRLGQLIEELVHQADQDVEAMTAQTQVVIRQALLVQAVLMVLTIAIALSWRQFVFRGLSLSISELRQGVTRISSGDLDHKLDIRTGDEIEELGDEFNKMADKLADVVDSLKQRNEHLQSKVQEYVAHMMEVVEGNLSARLALDENDREQDAPLLVLGRSMNEMTTAMQDLLHQVRNAANNLSSSAAEILATTTQQASGSSEQSAAIAQTTTTVDELKTIAEQSVVRAQEVASAAQRTVEVSRTGMQSVDETIVGMAQVKARVEGIAENILALSEQTQQIGEIITTVNDIAAQSNILALNASVEAARAGEYGKGFAVVAVEVRNLAEQSRQATAQVKAILSDIQQTTNATVMATEEGTKEVDEGVRLTEQAGEAIAQLAGVIGESAQAAAQMVAGGRQQAAGVEQVALAMQNINQVTAQSLVGVRQAEAAARDLNELASSLAEIVEQYEL